MGYRTLLELCLMVVIGVLAGNVRMANKRITSLSNDIIKVQYDLNHLNAEYRRLIVLEYVNSK